MVSLSVIIPTRNRAACLADALDSILGQGQPSAAAEVLVVDNGSTDSTREVVEARKAHAGQRLKYFFVSDPGLHIGRHEGAREACGEVLAYVDDDIIADRGWLAAVGAAFVDPAVGLVGGKVMPRWEGAVPDWVQLFKVKEAGGWHIGQLSLLDLGDQPKPIRPELVFGCNFAIRKKLVFECGGFHPDSVPQELIRFRGDGETALAQAVHKSGWKCVYEPKALVYHRVPKERLSVEYLCRRAFNQGVSDSFAAIRNDGGVQAGRCYGNTVVPLAPCGSVCWPRRLAGALVRRCLAWMRTPRIENRVRRAARAGWDYHRAAACRDPALLAYVLRRDYL